MSGNGRVAILLPSRGRRPELDRLLASFDATHTGHADIFVRNGEHDPTLAAYADLVHPRVTRIVGTDTGFGIWPDAGHCYAMEDLWRRNPGYSVYTMMEDDCTFPDAGWDQSLLAGFDQFPNRVGLLQWVVSGGPALIFAASDAWTSALGYFQYPPLGEAGYHGLQELARGDWSSLVLVVSAATPTARASTTTASRRAGRTASPCGRKTCARSRAGIGATTSASRSPSST